MSRIRNICFGLLLLVILGCGSLGELLNTRTPASAIGIIVGWNTPERRLTMLVDTASGTSGGRYLDVEYPDGTRFFDRSGSEISFTAFANNIAYNSIDVEGEFDPTDSKVYASDIQFRTPSTTISGYTEGVPGMIDASNGTHNVVIRSTSLPTGANTINVFIDADTDYYDQNWNLINRSQYFNGIFFRYAEVFGTYSSANGGWQKGRIVKLGEEFPLAPAQAVDRENSPPVGGLQRLGR